MNSLGIRRPMRFAFRCDFWSGHGLVFVVDGSGPTFGRVVAGARFQASGRWYWRLPETDASVVSVSEQTVTTPRDRHSHGFDGL
jgi:hypothetical protein